MALYLIGDVQGCDQALRRLLEKISFSASRDTLYLLGDLVNRGPDSAAVLRRLMSYGAAAQCVLGNHDLHLLAVAYGAGRMRRSDTMTGILQASDREAMLQWLRQQRMAMLQTVHGEDILMVHAGVLPGWSPDQTLALAAEVETYLRSADWVKFLQQMYSNEPAQWRDELGGMDRLRVIVNALTRLRFCTQQGVMEFANKGAPETAPAGYLPWYAVPGRLTEQITVACGHWSTLGQLDQRQVLALDTGCVWGGALSALRLADQPGASHQLIQVRTDANSMPLD
ncbi:MAG: symmetrical bis(5'-nucleosyl)-tetraphosphatase [Burkholderiaceae bacterium]